jgi:hypothetical protein
MQLAIRDRPHSLRLIADGLFDAAEAGDLPSMHFLHNPKCAEPAFSFAAIWHELPGFTRDGGCTQPLCSDLEIQVICRTGKPFIPGG